MPDPIDDIKAGITDAALKKKYNLKDEDLFTLKKYNYVINNGASKDEALELYPGVTKYLSGSKSSPVSPAAPAIKTFNPATDLRVTNNDRPAPISFPNMDQEKMRKERTEMVKMDRVVNTGINDKITELTGVPTDIRQPKDPLPEPVVKPTRLEKENQKKADEFYGTAGGKAYYNFIQPIWKTATKAGGNIIGAGARLAGNIASIGADPGSEGARAGTALDEFADNTINYFDFDRRAKENRGDSKLYTTPTKLQGGLINDDKLNVSKIIPSTIENLTNMAILLGGGVAGGGGKAGLFVSSYFNTVEDYRKQGQAAGLKGGQLDAFSTIASGLTGVLEGISPNKAITDGFKNNLIKTAIADIKNGVTVGVAVKRAAKTILKENGKEVTQELSQAIGDHVVKAVSDEASVDSQFNEDLSFKAIMKEVAETTLMTVLPTTLLMGPGTIRHFKPSNQVVSSLNYASENTAEFTSALDKAVAAGTYTPTEAQTMKDNIGLYSTKLKALQGMGYSPDQSAKIAFSAYKDAKLNQDKAAIDNSPALKATIGEEAKKDSDEIKNEIKDAAMGIPEVGTELSGNDLSKVVQNTPNSDGMVDAIKEKEYVVDIINLQEKYDNDPAFKIAVDTFEKTKEDPEGLRTPPILDASGKVLDGNKRLVQRYVNGERTARVFQELKGEEGGVPKVEESPVAEIIEPAPVEGLEEGATLPEPTSEESAPETITVEEPTVEEITPSVLEDDQTFDTPITNREQATRIADKMRAFADKVQVSSNAAYSRPDVIPRAMLASGIRLAAKAIEVGGSIADGIKAAVEFIKSKNPDIEENAIRDHVVDTLVDIGVIEPKKKPSSSTVKSSIKSTTSTVVKDKVIVNELTALKKKIKEKYKTIVSNEVKADIDKLLDDAEKRGVFTSTAKATAVASIARVLNKTKTPLKLIQAVDKITKILDNVEFEKDVNNANDTRSKIAKTIKGKSLARSAKNVETVKAFLKIKPENVEDIKKYNEIAAKVLESQKAVSVKILDGKAVIKDEGMELANRDIKNYTDQQLTYAEEQAKLRTAENYQDLVDLGVIDPATMSLKEMEDIIDLVNSPEPSPEGMNAAKQAEKERAFRELVQMQQSSLQDMYDANADLDILTPEEDGIIKKILALDPASLSISQMVRMNDVINNIIVNGEFYGAGELAILSEVQRDSKILDGEIKKSGIELAKFNNWILKGVSSIHLTFERIAKSTKLASRMQQLTGISGIFNGHSKATVTQERTLKEYQDLKDKYGKRIDDPENRYRRGVYSRVIQDLGGTAEEVQNEFDRVKLLIKQSADRLQSSEDKTELQEGKVLQKVYDEILDKANNAQQVKEAVEKIEPNNIKLVDFWIKKFNERVDEVADSSEIYNNKIFERYNNYTATKAKAVNGGTINQEQEDIFKVTMSSKKLDASPSKTKLNRIKSGVLPAGTAYDLDFDSVQAERFFDTNYDLETAPAIAKVRAFFDDPASANLLGGEKNKRQIMDGVKQAVLKQKNKQLPAPELERNFVRALNVLQAKGARIALGSISQLPKQYLSVASSTVINLGSDIGLFFKALGISNKIQLFDQSSIAVRGGAKAGYNHDADVAAIERSVSGNNLIRNTREALSGLTKIAETSMSALVNSDVSVARTSWLAYYMQDLKRQGQDISTIEWDKAHESFNPEAAAYAEQMVSRSQNPNNNTELGALYRDTKGGSMVLKNMLLPFSSFSVNQRVRMTNDMQKLLRGGEKAEAARSLAATAIETGVFNAIKIYALGTLTTMGARALASMFGFWDDEDEEKSKAYEEVEIKIGESSLNVTDKQKRLAGNMMSDYFFSGMGGMTQQAIQKGMNFIYSNIATENYPNAGKETKSPNLFYILDPVKQDAQWSDWGMYGITPAQYINATKNAEEAILGTTDQVVKGGMGEKVETETVDITSDEQNMAMLNFVINSFALFGVGDAEVTNMNRKMGSIMEKKMKERYGGENTLIISSKGKGQSEE